MANVAKKKSIYKPHRTRFTYDDAVPRKPDIAIGRMLGYKYPACARNVIGKLVQTHVLSTHQIRLTADSSRRGAWVTEYWLTREEAAFVALVCGRTLVWDSQG